MRISWHTLTHDWWFVMVGLLLNALTPSQWVAVCCSVLQCVAVCVFFVYTRMVDGVFVAGRILDGQECVDSWIRYTLNVCSRMLQCVAVRCGVLQCTCVLLRKLTRNVSKKELGRQRCSWWRVAVCWRMLQCVAVCCSVLQCVAVCRSVLQCVAVFSVESCSVLKFITVSCSLSQFAAVCCSVHGRELQCVIVTVVRCGVLWCAALWWSALQCIAVCCTFAESHVSALFEINQNTKKWNSSPSHIALMPFEEILRSQTRK